MSQKNYENLLRIGTNIPEYCSTTEDIYISLISLDVILISSLVYVFLGAAFKKQFKCENCLMIAMCTSYFLMLITGLDKDIRWFKLMKTCFVPQD